MGYSKEISIEIHEEDTCWEVTADIDFTLSGGCSPWKGSIYSCPSDVDWYGDAGDLCIDDITIVSVVEVDAEGKTTEVDLDDWELPIIEEYVLDNLDDDELYEAAADQVNDDFDPPEPDYYDYEYDY